MLLINKLCKCFMQTPASSQGPFLAHRVQADTRSEKNHDSALSNALSLFTCSYTYSADYDISTALYCGSKLGKQAGRGIKQEET